MSLSCIKTLVLKRTALFSQDTARKAPRYHCVFMCCGYEWKDLLTLIIRPMDVSPEHPEQDRALSCPRSTAERGAEKTRRLNRIQRSVCLGTMCDVEFTVLQDAVQWL